MVGARWEEIRIVDRSAVKEVGDRIEVEWMLSTKPELEWAEIFQLAIPTRRVGSVDWVMGGGPDVMEGMIRWIVPAAELEAAEAEVGERLATANERAGTGPSI